MQTCMHMHHLSKVPYCLKDHNVFIFHQNYLKFMMYLGKWYSQISAIVKMSCHFLHACVLNSKITITFSGMIKTQNFYCTYIMPIE